MTVPLPLTIQNVTENLTNYCYYWVKLQVRRKQRKNTAHRAQVDAKNVLKLSVNMLITVTVVVKCIIISLLEFSMEELTSYCKTQKCICLQGQYFLKHHSNHSLF